VSGLRVMPGIEDGRTDLEVPAAPRGALQVTRNVLHGQRGEEVDQEPRPASVGCRV
jgi:hypothetical protein